MQLTTLETTLLGILTTMGGGLIAYVLSRSSFVCTRDCEKRHKDVQNRLERGDSRFDNMDDKINALVINSKDIPDHDKVRLVGKGKE